MDDSESLFPLCALHGKPTKRQWCRECNAAYMRGYLRRRRRSNPNRSMWDRARKRAKARNVVFSISKDAISIPRSCPVLGIKIELCARRSASSPSLDRVVPARGYVPGNVRVISDRANRLKGDRGLKELRHLAEHGTEDVRDHFRRLVTYLEREQLLEEVRQKIKQGGRAGEEWAKIAFYLDRIFRKSIIK